MAFRFTLCADDYALSPAVSRGICEAIAAGRLTATSAMTNQPDWPRAACDLAPLAGADIGLHLNLTLGAPLGPMPELAPEGALPPIRRLVGLARGGKLPEKEIRAETDRQIDAFEALAGRPPDFVDGHQHVHVLPGLRDWLLDALGRRGLAGGVWLRDCADRPGRILARGGPLAKAFAIAWLGRGFARAAARRGFRVNDGFAGFSRFDPAADYGAAFTGFLTRPGPRHLVMCHPGHVDEALVALDPVTQTRENELRFLLSPDFATMLGARGAGLARLSRLCDEAT